MSKEQQLNQQEKLMKLTMASLRVDNPQDFHKVVETMDKMKSCQFGYFIYKTKTNEVSAYHVILNASYKKAVITDLETIREIKLEQSNFKNISEGIYDIEILRKARMELIYSLQKSLANIAVKEFLNSFKFNNLVIEKILSYEDEYDIFSSSEIKQELKLDYYTKKFIRESLEKHVNREKELLGEYNVKNEPKSRLNNKVQITNALSYNASEKSQNFLLDVFIQNKIQITPPDQTLVKKSVQRPLTIAKDDLRKNFKTNKYATFILSNDSIKQLSINGNKLYFESDDEVKNNVLKSM